MIYTVADKYRCTELGQVAAVMYLHPLTVLFLKNAFKRLHTDDELELDPMINIAIKAALVETGERSSLIGKGGVERALAEWIDEIPEKEILGTRYIDSGDFHELTENVSRMSSGASVTARLLGLMKLSKQFSVLSKRIRYGVRDDLIPLMDLSIPSLGRKSIRKLYSLGYVDLKELARAPSEEIVKLANLPESTVSVIKKYAKRLAELN
jgi:replicative superfamily II helicase